MPNIVVAPNLPGTASGTHAFDHRIVIERIGQDQAVRKEPGHRRDARMVGHVARRENERRFLAMEIRKLGLQLHQRPVCTRDVARSAGAGSHPARGGAHRFDHLRVLAHAKIIVRAPDHDVPLAARAVPERMGELSHLTLQVSEDAVATLPFQSSNGRLKTRVIVEHSWDSVSADQLDGSDGRPGYSLLGGSRRTLREWSRTENETNPSDIANHGGLI